MSTTLYYFTLVLHCIIACASITINALLLYCIHNRTPPNFQSYSILLKFQALSDMVISIAAIATMQRIIPCEWALVYISYGPCIFFNSDLCYYLYSILLSTNVASFVTVLVAMGARYWILRFGFISKRRIITTLCLAALTPALVFLSRADDNEVRKILLKDHPDYISAVVITGNTNSLAPPMLISQGIVICGPLPLFIVIWIYRSLILCELYKKTKAMSIHTRALHKQFVSALTLQAVLPVFPLFGVGVSLIGILGVASDPALEIAPIILCELPAFFSPLIVIRHIRYYSDAVRLLFRRETKEKVIGVSARSPTTAPSFAPY